MLFTVFHDWNALVYAVIENAELEKNWKQKQIIYADMYLFNTLRVFPRIYA